MGNPYYVLSILEGILRCLLLCQIPGFIKKYFPQSTVSNVKRKGFGQKRHPRDIGLPFS